MDLEFVPQAMLVLCFVLFACVVFFQRGRWRRSQRRRRRIRFYPTTMMIGLALQNLQVFAHPEIDHTIQQKYADAAEKNDEGDPDDPQKMLARQLKRIRDGEEVERLQVPLSEK